MLCTFGRLVVNLASKLYLVNGISSVLFPDVRRITNHETVESDPGVLELEPLILNPQMGATDDAKDDPPSLFSDFRLVVANSVVPATFRHKPATGEHFQILPMTVPFGVFCEVVTKSMSDPAVGRSTVSSSRSAEATHVSPDNSGNKSESIESPISDEANGWSTNSDCVSASTCTDHIAETFRRHSNVVIPVGTQT